MIFALNRPAGNLPCRGLRAQGEDEAAGTRGVVTGTGLHPGVAPADQSEHDILEVCAERGELAENYGKALSKPARTMPSVSSWPKNWAIVFIATPGRPSCGWR